MKRMNVADEPKGRVAKAFSRAVPYMYKGAQMASFPLTLATFVRVFYPDLDVVFVVIAFAVALGSILFGYFWMKSPFFKSEMGVATEANQYTTIKYPPVNVPMTKALVELLEKNGVDCSEVRVILERSQ